MVKGKVVSVLNKHHAMKRYVGGGGGPAPRGIAAPFLTSALGGGELSASLHGRLTTGDKAPDTHCVGDHSRS
jgi:hypothetical protein